MRIWLRDHGLVLVLSALFLVFVMGMTISGWHVSNSELVEHGDGPQPLAAYLVSGDFWEALFENWESEFLQMGAYVVFTVFLFQKGSPESKKIGEENPQDEDPKLHASDPRAPWPVRRGGVWLALYENSLLILFGVLFLGSLVGHALGGLEQYNEEQRWHGLPEVSVGEFASSSDFWFQSFQNWQSEFMVMAVLAGAAVYLRQRGSSQSKPVAAPHSETGM
jgi:membrane protein implicated in regulation of membrane protease activity